MAGLAAAVAFVGAGWGSSRRQRKASEFRWLVGAVGLFLSLQLLVVCCQAVSAWKSSPVRFFGLFGQDRDRDRSIKTHTSRKTGPRPQKTAKSVFAVFLRSLDRSELVFVLKTVATNLYI